MARPRAIDAAVAQRDDAAAGGLGVLALELGLDLAVAGFVLGEGEVCHGEGFRQ